jgi:hypothetical protein
MHPNSYHGGANGGGRHSFAGSVVPWPPPPLTFSLNGMQLCLQMHHGIVMEVALAELQTG